MRLLLEEYINSGDVTEAIQCLKELDVPHFHHELVYEVRNDGHLVSLLRVNRLRNRSILDAFNGSYSPLV